MQEYRQTEFGPIPSDWILCTFQDVLATFSSGATPYRGIPEYYKGNVRWISSGELNFNKIFDTIEHISQQAVRNANLRVHQPGTFLMAITGLEAEGTRGRCAFVGAPATTNQSCLAINGTERMCTEYLFWFYRMWGQYLAFKYCQGTKQQSYTANIVRNLPIYGPKDISEQQAIAEALSDMDGLIAALDKKIAKKRLIKQGTMQQLLTGKKRLPGFTDPWVEKKLGEILDYEQPQPYLVVSTDYVDSGIPVLTAGKSLILGYTTEQFGIYNKLPVIIFDDFTTDSKYISYPFKVKSSAMKMLALKNNDYDLRLVYELMQQIDFPLKDHQRYWISAYSQLTIFLPQDREEQQAIATILSDMDKEISDLEAKRDKYRLLKSGMMQKLLTGQIRLIKSRAKVVPLVPEVFTAREIPVDAHILAGHIVNRLWQSKGWGRTKLQKSLHLIGYCVQLNLGNEYIRNTAGPDDQLLMNYIDQKFKQYRHVKIVKERWSDGTVHYSYFPTSLVQELEMAYERYPQDIREHIDMLLDKLSTMNLAGAEILSTLYAVWNNRIIKGEQVTDDLLLADFYAWSKHKADFEERKVRKALDYMRKENIIPVGWGKYIDKK